MKLSRISLIVAVALTAILALTVSANAFSNEDLATYITTPHMIGGTQYKLSDSDAVAAKQYLVDNPVTDSEAAQIKGLLDQALAKVNGDTSLSQLSQTEKTEIISLLQRAGNIAGVTVAVDTNANSVTVSHNGTVIMSGSYADGGNGGLTVKYANNGGSTGSAGAAGTASNGGASTFVYTGANNSVFAVIALLAVVAVSTVLVKKAYAK